MREEEDAPKIKAAKEAAERQKKQQEEARKQAEEEARIKAKNELELAERQDPSGAKRIREKLEEENAKLFGIKKTDVEKLYDHE